MQGNCDEPFEESATLQSIVFSPPMYQRKPGQCALIGLTTFFEVQQASDELWIDNLYLRMQRDAKEQTGQARLLNFSKNSAWLTNVTLQGDAGDTQALYPLDQAKVYVQGMQLPFKLPVNLLGTPTRTKGQ